MELLVNNKNSVKHNCKFIVKQYIIYSKLHVLVQQRHH